jgi:hypothetical protein
VQRGTSSPATSPALKSAEAGFGPDAVGPKPSTFLSTFRTGFVGKFGTAGKEVLCGLSPTSRNYEWLGRLGPVSEGWESRSSASGAEGHWFESSIARSKAPEVVELLGALNSRITSAEPLFTFLSTFAAGMLKGILLTGPERLGVHVGVDRLRRPRVCVSENLLRIDQVDACDLEQRRRRVT